jgi:hypothetical protein
VVEVHLILQQQEDQVVLVVEVNMVLPVVRVLPAKVIMEGVEHLAPGKQVVVVGLVQSV